MGLGVGEGWFRLPGPSTMEEETMAKKKAKKKK
jgi:hypothetical protein